MISLSLLKLCSLSKEKWIPFDFVNKLSWRSLSTPHKKVILWGPRCTRDDRNTIARNDIVFVILSEGVAVIEESPIVIVLK